MPRPISNYYEFIQAKDGVAGLNNCLRRGKRGKKVLTEEELEKVAEDIYAIQQQMDEYELKRMEKTK